MYWLKKLIKKIVGDKVVSMYHRFLSWLAAVVYGHPSDKLVVIGVTGTNGKSTTAYLAAKILEAAGNKVALSSTLNFKIAEQEWLNDLKMTMPGRFFLQRFLSQAVEQGCRYAIIESTSQGVLQSRHLGINYDVMVLTNLTPEHIEAHGGFEKYKSAKLEYFRRLEKLPTKKIGGLKINKVIIVNADDQYADEFLNYTAAQKITYGKSNPADIKAEQFSITSAGITFSVSEQDFKLKLKGIFDVYNALAAISVAKSLGIGLDVCKSALEKQELVPGRMELINLGQPFQVMVDYAYEPESLKQVFETISKWDKNKVIHIVGSAGGGRDVARRKILGEMSAQNADIVIVTNEDPYDEDPMQIIEDVASAASASGKIAGQDLFKILDRREAITKALTLAQANDLVLITGKGAEQKMGVKGGYLDWDDRKVVSEELSKLK